MKYLFFDIESTGLDVNNDKIVSLAIKIIDENGKVTLNKSKLYNPEREISKEAFETHGISNEDVKKCPTFSQDAKKLTKIFENKIIITYNGLKFDLPLLNAEFEREGLSVNWSGKFIDCLLIEKKLNPSTLCNVYKQYTGLELEEAHSSQADVDATNIVFQHQLKIIKEQNEDALEACYELSGTNDLIDISGKLKRDSEGFLIFNFGKAKGVRVINDPNYAAWILNEKFPAQVKKLIREEQSKHLSNKKEETKPKKQGFHPVTLPNDYPIKKDGKLF